MSMPALAAPLTFEQYLDFETGVDIRYELVSGQAFAMSGGTRRHNLLANAVAATLLGAAGDGPCRVYQQGMKLRIDATTSYYPDVFVACEDVLDDDRFETSPCLIVEVLSPSTAAIDRREKRSAYLSLSALQAYLILDPDAPRGEYHQLQSNNTWSASSLTDSDILDLACVDLSIPLLELYRSVR